MASTVSRAYPVGRGDARSSVPWGVSERPEGARGDRQQLSAGKPHDRGDRPARRYSVDASGLSKLAGYLREGRQVGCLEDLPDDLVGAVLVLRRQP
jgi:hypothetical protein